MASTDNVRVKQPVPPLEFTCCEGWAQFFVTNACNQAISIELRETQIVDGH